MDDDALERAELAEVQEELACFHALDEDMTEIPERKEGGSHELVDGRESASAMEEEEVRR